MPHSKIQLFTFLFFISIYSFSQSEEVYSSYSVPQELKTKEGDIGNFISKHKIFQGKKIAALEIIPDEDFEAGG